MTSAGRKKKFTSFGSWFVHFVARFGAVIIVLVDAGVDGCEALKEDPGELYSPCRAAGRIDGEERDDMEGGSMT
jgi:hypothetical protein